MGLLADTFNDTFSFWTKHFSKLILYQLFFLIFIGIAVLLIIIGVLFSFFTETATIDSSLVGEGFAPSIPFFVTLIIAEIIFIVFGSIQTAGYSLLVNYAIKNKEISTIDIFKKSLSKWYKIVAVRIGEGFPMMIFAVIAVIGLVLTMIPFYNYSIYNNTTAPFGNETVLPPDLVTATVNFLLFFLVMIPIYLIAFYFTIRLWLSTPVLMIEEKGVVDSLKRSWAMTSGKFWSSFGTLLVIGIIISILALISIAILSVFGILLFYLIFAPISAIVPTIYYLNMSRKKTPEEKISSSKK